MMTDRLATLRALARILPTANLRYAQVLAAIHEERALRSRYHRARFVRATCAHPEDAPLCSCPPDAGCSVEVEMAA